MMIEWTPTWPLDVSLRIGSTAAIFDRGKLWGILRILMDAEHGTPGPTEFLRGELCPINWLVTLTLGLLLDSICIVSSWFNCFFLEIRCWSSIILSSIRRSSCFFWSSKFCFKAKSEVCLSTMLVLCYRGRETNEWLKWIYEPSGNEALKGVEERERERKGEKIDYSPAVVVVAFHTRDWVYSSSLELH